MRRIRLGLLVFGLVLVLLVIALAPAKGAEAREPKGHPNGRRSSVARVDKDVPKGQAQPSEPETGALALALLAKDEADRGAVVEWVRKHAERGRPEGESEQIVESVLKTEDPLLLLSLFRLESRFNPSARSPEGALGLGQVARGHVPRLKARGIIRSESDLLRIDENVRAAEHVWRAHLEEAGGDRRRALSRFGGFRSRAADPYLRKVYAGVGELAAVVIRSRADRVLLARGSVEVPPAVEGPLE